MGPSADLIDAYLTHLALIGRSPVTIRQWRHTLTRADRQLPYGLEAAAAEELQRWIAQPPAQPSRLAYWVALKGFYAWATRPDDQWLDSDPMQGVTRPATPEEPPPDPVTDAELEVILTRSHGQYLVWSALAAYAGCRALEVSRMDREHIRSDGVRIHGKGGKRRVVPLHDLVAEVVADLPPGPVARRRDGGRCTAQAVSQAAIRHYVALGLVDVHLHRLRHWFGTRALEATGGDIRTVQVLMGHSSIATTQRYTLVAAGRRDEAVSGLPTLGGGSAEVDGATGSGAGPAPPPPRTSAPADAQGER